MADQDYPNLYADMEASAVRTRNAAIAFEHVLGGPEADMVPVNGYPDQPTISGRVKKAIETLTAPVNAAIEAAKRFLGAMPVAPSTRADGSALKQGDEYFNTVSKTMFLWSGTTWYTPNVDGQALGQSTGATMVGAVLRSGQAGQLQQALDEINSFLAVGVGFTTASVASMKLLDKRFASSAQTGGYYATGDGGGAFYRLDPQDTTSADDGVLVHVAADGGRWKLNHNGRVSVKQVGVRASNTGAQNKLLLQKASVAFRSLYFPAGETFKSEPLFLSADTELYGAGFGSVLEMVTPATLTMPDGSPAKHLGLLHVDSGSATSQISGIEVHDMTLKGTVDTEGFREFVHLIALNGARNVHVFRAQLLGFRGDAVYMGSGPTDVSQRHNNMIFVYDNVIDGINKDNRNPLSIVDGTDVYFFRNYVKNSTRSNMPGAVDVEPQNSFDTARNIYVDMNTFENIGGTSGVMGMYTVKIAADFAFINPPNNINFRHNTLINCNNAGGAWGAKFDGNSAGPNTPRLDMTVEYNKVYGGNRVAVVVGVHGVTHRFNQYFDTNYGMFLGLKVNGSLFRFETNNNNYTRVGKSNAVDAGYGVQVSTVSRLRVRHELFVDCGKADGSFGVPLYFVDGSSDYVELKGNRIENPGNKTTYGIKALNTHFFDPQTNAYGDNWLEVAGNDFKWRASDYGDFTFDTLPGALPQGRWVIVGSGTAFGSGKGVLESFSYRDPVELSIAGSTYQRFTPSATVAGKAKQFAERKVDPNTGGWTTPHWFTGV